MFTPEVFQSTIAKLVKLLRKHNIRFHITGGITSIAHGEPRMTQDVDVVVDNANLASDLPAFLESVAATDFLHSPEEIREALQRKGMFQLIDGEESLKLDIYVREMIPGELDRSVQAEIFVGEVLPVASRADTALAKLMWINQGSHKSRRDLRFLHRVADEGEKRFIADTAAQFGLTDLLAEVLAEPDEIRP